MPVNVLKPGGCGLLVAVLLLLACAGCASPARLDGVTGGLSLTMFVNDGTGAQEYFVVSADGSLGYGGGTNAILQKVVWTDQLTSAEIATLNELVLAHDWCGRDWKSTKVPEDMRYDISLNSPACRRGIRVRGEHPDLKDVRLLLHDAALRRFNDDLERLPKPSIQK